MAASVVIVREHSLNPLAINRARQIPWARRVLGLFLAVWLNMALQPCAMAFADMQGRNCLHCPPAHTMDMSSPVSPMAHDAIPQHVPCMTQASQCEVLDDYNIDGRSMQSKVKDAQSDMPIDIVHAFVGVHVPDAETVSFSKAGAFCQPGAEPPLNLLYCVYLI